VGSAASILPLRSMSQPVRKPTFVSWVRLWVIEARDPRFMGWLVLAGTVAASTSRNSATNIEKAEVVAFSSNNEGVEFVAIAVEGDMTAGNHDTIYSTELQATTLRINVHHYEYIM
jgi:hypothetical protein